MSEVPPDQKYFMCLAMREQAAFAVQQMHDFNIMVLTQAGEENRRLQTELYHLRQNSRVTHLPDAEEEIRAYLEDFSEDLDFLSSTLHTAVRDRSIFQEEMRALCSDNASLRRTLEDMEKLLRETMESHEQKVSELTSNIQDLSDRCAASKAISLEHAKVIKELEVSTKALEHSKRVMEDQKRKLASNEKTINQQRRETESQKTQTEDLHIKLAKSEDNSRSLADALKKTKGLSESIAEELGKVKERSQSAAEELAKTKEELAIRQADIVKLEAQIRELGIDLSSQICKGAMGSADNMPPRSDHGVQPSTVKMENELASGKVRIEVLEKQLAQCLADIERLNEKNSTLAVVNSPMEGKEYVAALMEDHSRVLTINTEMQISLLGQDLEIGILKRMLENGGDGGKDSAAYKFLLDQQQAVKRFKDTHVGHMKSLEANLVNTQLSVLTLNRQLKQATAEAKRYKDLNESLQAACTMGDPCHSFKDKSRRGGGPRK